MLQSFIEQGTKSLELEGGRDQAGREEGGEEGQEQVLEERGETYRGSGN